MSKKRVLFITQGMNPYSAAEELSEIVRKLTQKTSEHGLDVRILMPKFGTINERRHKLHEVVRLSGMNIIVDDEDYPLIIKVASLPGARLQVYFLDNDEFFKRKFMFEDADGKPFDDNQERTVFFCKSALETVKKFGWAPDIIHCNGWITSLIPLYIKTVYKDDPIFESAKVLYSVYTNSLGHTFTPKFLELASINNLESADLAAYDAGGSIDLLSGALKYSDAIIKGSDSLDESVIAKIEDAGKPVLDYAPLDEFMPSCIDFYLAQLDDDEEEGEA